jgi:signal transduction histidine kinase
VQFIDAAESSPPTNLDLLISQEVIACLGGRLWAERDLQYGAKFSFCLPLEPTYQNC